METKPAAWTEQEERAIVRDYLSACDALNRGERVNKSASRRALIAGPLAGRNEGSVEFKRCNVSACLQDLGFAHWPGYLPSAGANYSRRLYALVEAECKARADAAAQRAAVAA